MMRKFLIGLKLTSVAPVVLALRALKPLILVRFGSLNSLAFGMFAQATELYLCEREAELQPKRTLDLFHYGIGISNQQLKTMWGRTLHVPPLGNLLAHANDVLPGGNSHKIHMPNDEDRNGVIPRSQRHLFFNAAEKRLGQAGLRELGVPDGASFVCIYARDQAYKGSSRDHKWSPLFNQDETNHGYRNTSINNYISAAEKLAERGHFVIRMGSVVNEPLMTDNPMIIDYATKFRTDFMDIYISGTCRFFLGGTGGLNTIPRIFRRPVVMDNLALTAEVCYAMYPNNLFIPKKFWHRENQRFMTFKEFIETCPNGFDGATHFENIGVDLIDNTPQELLDVALEMDERISGTWQSSKEDDDLQERCWELLEMPQPDQAYWPRAGADFLRQNQELLN